MSQFNLLVDFVKLRFPGYAYILQPDAEIAVDGRIFRPESPDGLIFKDENGEQSITLAEAQGILEEDLQE